MERLVEMTGDVTPFDRFAHLAGRMYTIDRVRLHFEKDGRFRCTAAEGEELPDEAEQVVRTVLEAMAFTGRVAATVTVSGFTYEAPAGGRSRKVMSVAATAVATASVSMVVGRGDGSVSPNPDETAWLARVLRSDSAVAVAYELLREAMTTPNRRTVVDYIAFEAMKQAEDRGWPYARKLDGAKRASPR